MSSEPLIGSKKFHFTQLDSTNVEAKRMIDRNEWSEGNVIIADYQTEGRGQYGKTWESQANLNVMMSIILAPIFLKIDQQFLLNISVSLAVAKVVSEYSQDVLVKWPNDIFVRDNKVAGILIQNFIQKSRIKNTIIGIGLNVNQQSWPSDILGATSIGIESNSIVDKKKVIDKLCSEFEIQYKRLQLNSKNLVKEYQERLYKKNISAYFNANNEIFRGKIKGIDKIGRLLVEREGNIGAYNHGQIALLKDNFN